MAIHFEDDQHGEEREAKLLPVVGTIFALYVAIVGGSYIVGNLM